MLQYCNKLMRPKAILWRFLYIIIEIWLFSLLHTHECMPV